MAESRLIKIKEISPNKGQIPNVNKNPRSIKGEKFDKLCKSITDNPEMLELRELLVYPYEGKYVCIGGNMRYEACKKLGYKEVPCKVIPTDTPAETLNAYIIKDNNPYGEWDWDALGNEWDSALLDDWGLDCWKNEDDKKKPKGKDDGFDESKVDVEKKCQKGDIWQLGSHRLMCGDSTDAGSVALLMNGERADVCFTSPPYNMGINGKPIFVEGCANGYTTQAYNSYSDALSDEDYSKLLCGAMNNALAFCDDAMFNIGIIKGSKAGILAMLSNFAPQFGDILVWRKSAAMALGLPSQKGIPTHHAEFIFCFNAKGRRNFSHCKDSVNCSNVIESCNAAVKEDIQKDHHATFPVEFALQVVGDFTENSVLDLFGGTGTTLIAAEQLGRKSFTMELDPHYCDIIIARWEQFTNLKAEKLN